MATRHKVNSVHYIAVVVTQQKNWDLKENTFYWCFYFVKKLGFLLNLLLKEKMQV